MIHDLRATCPSTALCLGDLVINPHQQQMEPFNWVMDWESMLSLSSLMSLLDKNFFPKWLQVSENTYITFNIV